MEWEPPRGLLHENRAGGTCLCYVLRGMGICAVEMLEGAWMRKRWPSSGCQTYANG